MIDEVLISRDVISEDFQCNLSKCKGACCWEGDYGAPLAKHEIHHLEQCIDEIKSELPIAHQDVIDKQGWHRKYKNDTFDGTQLMDDGRCVFMQHSEVGIAYCTIEKLEGAGKIQTKKPISCHLYPVRVAKNENRGFTALNYDRWDICSAACALGRENKVPVYQFVKNALIRMFGQSFYDQLDEIAKKLKEGNI